MAAIRSPSRPSIALPMEHHRRHRCDPALGQWRGISSGQERPILAASDSAREGAASLAGLRAKIWKYIDSGQACRLLRLKTHNRSRRLADCICGHPAWCQRRLRLSGGICDARRKCDCLTDLRSGYLTEYLCVTSVVLLVESFDKIGSMIFNCARAYM